MRTLLVLTLVLAGCSSSPDPPAEGDDVLPPRDPVLQPGSPANGGAPSGGAKVDVPAGGGPKADPPKACTGKLAQPRDNTWTIVSSRTNRTAHVHVPAKYDPKTPTPVVLNFHGLGNDPGQEELLSQMTPKSDQEGFIVVYPQGVNASWNAGIPFVASEVDDVAFANDLIDALELQLCVDTQRVFAAGMSNGAFLSHRLGCELSNRIAAIAPVAGVENMATCNPSRPMPVMAFHGGADLVVPYGGSALLGFNSAATSFDGWRARNKCTGAPAETYRKGDSRCSTYSKCEGGAEVTLCTIDLGGHTWPGGFPALVLGYTTNDISATDEMWKFFTRHPLP